MTIDEGLDLADLLLRLRREVAGLARSVDGRSANFTIEWRAALDGIAGRLATLTFFEQQLAPVLAPPGVEPFTLEQYRAWLVRLAHRDEEGHPVPAATPSRPLHRSVH